MWNFLLFPNSSQIFQHGEWLRHFLCSHAFNSLLTNKLGREVEGWVGRRKEFNVQYKRKAASLLHNNGIKFWLFQDTAIQTAF